MIVIGNQPIAPSSDEGNCSGICGFLRAGQRQGWRAGITERLKLVRRMHRQLHGIAVPHGELVERDGLRKYGVNILHGESPCCVIKMKNLMKALLFSGVIHSKTLSHSKTENRRGPAPQSDADDYHMKYKERVNICKRGTIAQITVYILQQLNWLMVSILSYKNLRILY